MIWAPCARMVLARWTAVSVLRQTLSRYHESADKLITPMIAGLELNANGWLPMENSRTRTDAAVRFFSSKSARYSSVSMGMDHLVLAAVLVLVCQPPPSAR